MSNHWDTIIIGGGAAGIFAAINLAEQQPNLKVLVLEKSNQLLSKVKVSGGGRCNVTHACFDPQELIQYYPRGQKELLSPFYQFQPGDTMEWFQHRGVALKIEEDGRIFPTSDNSQTIIDCFLKELQKKQIQVWQQTKVTAIHPKENSFQIQTNKGGLSCLSLLIATGGFPQLKSYEFMQHLQHEIIHPTPSLFTFNLPKHPILQLQGLAHPVTIQIKDTSFVESGPVLITHWGMSGPAVLKLSAWAARYLNAQNYEFEYSVNWLPNHDLDEVFILMNEYKRTSANRKVNNLFDFSLPKKLKTYLLHKANVQNLNWGDVSKQQLQKLLQILFQDLYRSKGKTTFKQEFVTCGGIHLREINFKTMESKLIPNLYFAGEVIDIDALTGGFNFQAAWTTGWIAAQSIAKKQSN